MAKVEVPAKVEYVCDRCGGKNFQDGGLHLKGHIWSRDALGNAGGADKTYDFCTGCVGSFILWLRNGVGSEV